MKYEKSNGSYLIRIDKGEDLGRSLAQFAESEGLSSGHLSGIGALEKIELGFYHLSEKRYDRKIFEGEAELLSLEGNLSTMNGAPFFHLHAMFSDENYACFGGHLFGASVAVTCEIEFRPMNLAPIRVLNEEIGLNLLAF